jgi:hypothetical protein
MKESITNKNLVFCNNYLAGCSCWLMMLCDCILILKADLVVSRSNILTMPGVKLCHVGSKVKVVWDRYLTTCLELEASCSPSFYKKPNMERRLKCFVWIFFYLKMAPISSRF